MNRKEFFKVCGLACIGGAAISAVLQSCTSSNILEREIIDSHLIIPISDFEIDEDDKTAYKKYIIVYNQMMKFPVCVYRFSESKYTALWMECTHKGVELKVMGDKLHCPAHGSEFSNTGEVKEGPASEPLQTFPVTIDNNQLKISLG